MSDRRKELIVNENKSDVGKIRETDNSGENFVPPDGGWGWIIVIAAGFSNFCTFPILQSFGLIFREKFAELGINSSQTTTILNVNCTVTSILGLVNGPLFRKFSYRQVAFVGSLICAISITILSTMTTFTGCIVFFSILFGAGLGVTMSSNSLALNTYFKKKRRIAIGLSWTCTGMGPIVMPQIITQLMPLYGVTGTVLIFGGFAFNAVVCALLLQPVLWHVKNKHGNTEIQENQEIPQAVDQSPENVPENASKSLEDMDENTKSNLNFSTGRFGSQYLYYDDEEDGPSGIDVMEPGTPMMSRANDGWFSRRHTSTPSIGSKGWTKENPKISRLSMDLSKHTLKQCRKEALEQKPVVIDEVERDQLIEKEFPEEERKKTFLEALIIFFDLDLLRDLVYVNILLGMTFANFTELNFSLLTPFILSEYGFSKMQVATCMSILAGVDVGTRLIIPFVADFIGWQNRTFYLVGVCGIAAGRIVMAHVQDFQVTIAVAILIGVGKALRTVFVALVISSHVPLSRLPGATGLQLLTNGVVFLTLGPVVGWIRDVTSDYSIMLHCLNVFTYLTTISWMLEIYFVKRKSRKLKEKGNQ